MSIIKTETGLPLCSFVVWKSEDCQDVNHDQHDVSLIFCCHPGNIDQFESNCQDKNCPFVFPGKLNKSQYD